MSVPVIAFSDIHSPKYTDELMSILKNRCRSNKADLMLVAGDIVSEGKWQFSEYLEGASALCEPKRFIGVFGNEDYEEAREKIREKTPSVEWLDDQSVDIVISGLTFRIFGSVGILDEPTRWQIKNIPQIHDIYKKRLELLKSHCALAKDMDVNLILTHYPPTYNTLVGEPHWAWRQMGSKRAEAILLNECGPAHVFHGHAHNSKALMVNLKGVTFINVAFPPRRDIVYVQLRKRAKLDNYF